MLRLLIVRLTVIVICKMTKGLQHRLGQLQLLILPMPKIECLLPAALCLRKCRFLFPQTALGPIRQVLLLRQLVPLAPQLLLPDCQPPLYRKPLLNALPRLLKFSLIGMKAKAFFQCLQELIRQEALALIGHGICFLSHTFQARIHFLPFFRPLLFDAANLFRTGADIVLLLIDLVFFCGKLHRQLPKTLDEALLLLLQLIGIALAQLLPLLLHGRLLRGQCRQLVGERCQTLLCCRKSVLLRILLLLVFLQLLFCPLSRGGLFVKHAPVVSAEDIGNAFCSLPGRLLGFQLETKGIHVFNCLRHGPKILLRKSLESRAQNIVDDRGLKVPGKLRGSELNQKIQHFPVGIRRGEAEELLVDKLDILCLSLIDPAALCQTVFQLLPG